MKINYYQPMQFMIDSHDTVEVIPRIMNFVGGGSGGSLNMWREQDIISSPANNPYLDRVITIAKPQHYAIEPNQLIQYAEVTEPKQGNL